MAGYTLTSINKLRLTNEDRESWYADYIRNMNIIDGKLLSANAVTNSMLAADAVEDENVAAAAAIQRSKLASGSADHVVINNASGVMISEATLAKTRGGTGADNSSVTFPSTGVIVTRDATETLTNKTIDGDDNILQDISISSLKTVLADANEVILRDASGVVSSALLANVNVSASAAIAYSKLNLSGSILNADINSSAAIARSKLASGTASHVIINDGSGVLSSEAQLSVSRGGTGLSALGTSNQVLGVDNAGNVAEYKTISSGTTGTDFAIVNAANAITFNLPTSSAANRGALSSSDWSTFNAKVGGSGTNGQIALFNGAGTVTSDASIAYDTGADTNNISLSSGIKIGSNADAAASAGAGSLRYSMGNLEYSDGAVWQTLGLSGGISSLNSLTAGAQSFANDTNVTITSATATHTLGWSGQLSIARGGTGLGTLGTSNQILGVDNGATAAEYKTLSVGTSGTDFAIAHSAGGVAFNLPDAGASARGVVTTGTQTFAGVKTFSSNAVFSSYVTLGDIISRDNSDGSVSNSSGQTLWHPNLNIQSGHTYTIAGELLTNDEITGDGTIDGDGTVVDLSTSLNNINSITFNQPGGGYIKASSDNNTLEINRFLYVGIGNDIAGSFNAAARNLVVGNGVGNNGITIFSGSTSQSALSFAYGTNTTEAYDSYIGYNHNSKALSFYNNLGTLALQINSSQSVIPQKLLDLSTATAGQIKFPASQNASADANTLDDYEEGTWTPADVSGAGLSLTSVSGTYTKIGRLVRASFAVTYPATASTAQAAINLPITASSSTSNGGFTVFSTKATEYPYFVIGGSSANCFPYIAGGANYNNVNLSGQTIRAVMVYEA